MPGKAAEGGNPEEISAAIFAPGAGYKASRWAYSDILDLPHHASPVHPAMPVADRAAQFMPFAALTGFGNAVCETERLTEERLEPEVDVLEELDGKLRHLKEHISEHPEISVTYFKPDMRKAGGAYITETGRIKRIDVYERILVMDGNVEIPIKEVVGIEGALFSDL